MHTPKHKLKISTACSSGWLRCNTDTLLTGSVQMSRDPGSKKLPRLVIMLHTAKLADPNCPRAGIRMLARERQGALPGEVIRDAEMEELCQLVPQKGGGGRPSALTLHLHTLSLRVPVRRITFIISRHEVSPLPIWLAILGNHTCTFSAPADKRTISLCAPAILPRLSTLAVRHVCSVPSRLGTPHIARSRTLFRFCTL